MNTLKIPYVQEPLHTMSFEDLDRILELKGARAQITNVNWPEEFPYAPLACASVVRTPSHIVVRYTVSGLDLRAVAMEDNGRIWEDSCCEFFVSHPSDGTYYNFELNCIGVLLAAKRTGRSDPHKFSAEQLSSIVRHSTLAKKEYDVKDEVLSWRTAICIPLQMIGLDPDNLPESVNANFYKCADLAAHPHFLSWNPVETPSPDFHRPEFFGKLYF